MKVQLNVENVKWVINREVKKIMSVVRYFIVRRCKYILRR